MFNHMEDVVKIGGSCCAWFANLVISSISSQCFKGSQRLKHGSENQKSFFALFQVGQIQQHCECTVRISHH